MGQGGRTSCAWRRGALVAIALCALAALTEAKLPAAVAAPATFEVNLASDESDASLADGACDVDAGALGDQCTLRAAIQQANDTADADTIAFAISGAGVHGLAPATPLPIVTQPVTIDGYTQHGARVNTRKLGHGDNAALKIELSGKRLPGPGDTGLTIAAGAVGTEVRGLVINRFNTGILVKGAAVITGNFIGTDPSGARDRGNDFDGIFGFGGTRTTIGGPSPAARNVISANGDSGITTNATMTVQGNYIGTASDGVSPLGNRVQFHDAAVELAGPSNVIGGSAGGANVIAFNEGKGIDLLNTAPASLFSRNRIFENGGLAIDLGEDGRTPNDPGDGDTGPNGLQNFPVLHSAKSGRHHARVKGTLDSTTSTDFTIELYANPPHTHQAKAFLGSLHVSTGPAGRAAFTFKGRRIARHRTITATAIAPDGATSEVSASVVVRAP